MPLITATPDSLQLGRFTLRILTASDWHLEQELSRDEDVIRWTLFPAYLSADNARRRVERAAAARRENLLARYALCDGDQVLGTAGISSTVHDTPEIMYALLPAGRGRGAATAAARGLSDWALAGGFPTVVLRTIVGNVQSEAVARRAGFRPIRTERQSQRRHPVEMLFWTRSRGGGPRSGITAG
ncbi:GNAT family N-acetyltransferase [Arthrobacter zhangbolii]|uniref:GNAT family N-acetyltransferase n=1 Tax=Arthrobacter zhangbolii TaxID=2886936 RepID=A0A9X1M5I5_9MICC|nr:MULTISPECIES: GNAT family protein [Arthrobacter]MCC3271788.1 GNAT family N-acetyltransferase [Arthrobacter zhangbolii]MDN3904862.1 GNAT family protein [Arthrobacter sp. YD2]UON93386.1 GNAT family N-acetyltransferase [Arthrobacter zhangbolii]